jgi:hypothetical protein
MITDKSKLADLIARLEVAEHGSRELDLDVHRAAYCWLADAEIVDEFDGVFKWRKPGSSTWRIAICGPYTTSLDAITALIAEKMPGWFVSSVHMPEGFRAPDYPAFEANLVGNIRERQFGFDEPPEMDHDTINGAANTEPLARCIAFLRAIEGTSHD